MYPFCANITSILKEKADIIVGTLGGILALVAIVVLMYMILEEFLPRKRSDIDATPKSKLLSFPLVSSASVRMTFLIVGVIAVNYFSGDKVKNADWSFFGLGGTGQILQPAADGFAGVHYLSSPLFSGILRLFHLMGMNEALTAVLISIFCFIGSALVLYKITSKLCGEKSANRSVIFLCFAPFAVLFGLPYSFSLTLLLILGTYYCAKTENILGAAVFGMLAVASNIIAIVLMPCLIALGTEKKEMDWRSFIAPAVIFVFTIIFMVVLQSKYHIEIIQSYKGLEGIKQIFSTSGPEFYFKSMPLILYLLTASAILFIARHKLPFHLFLYALILVPIPFFVKNIYAEISLLSFPLYIALSKLTVKKPIFNAVLYFSVILSGLMMAAQMKFLLY